MSPTVVLRLLPAALLLAASAAWSQSSAVPSSRADPLDANAPVPPFVYVSPLMPQADRRDAKAPTWREANEAVGRIGGWRAYAREAARPEPSEEAQTGKPVSGAATTPGPQAGQKTP